MSDSSSLAETIRQGIDQVTHRAFREHIRFVKASGLTMPQFNILMQLHYQHECGLSDISARMEISNAAASQLVEKLVQAGLLERAEDPNDRRAKQLRLSAQGQRLVEASMAARHRWMDELIEQMEPAEREVVAAGMRLLLSRLPAGNKPY
ncbi:MAG: MarR family transcriptional regulator [Anaerolineales bacterium]|nr:MarR family transcriptional regulator [Anaerolineales bacterium]MCX7755083.1 MarR family transcriptional regulator [Anaerolineales bacterium]MDW8277564.1 MarR family transcriptional regulator [Anaerolineales bacterium]